jgi:hypothetical protein
MIIAVAVNKHFLWRGSREDFTNVWHYDTSVDTTAQELADAVVAKERTVYGRNVNFSKVQAWGPADGTKAQNQMLVQQVLTGTGEVNGFYDTAKELTAVLSWDTGRVNSRGGKIFLRKYMHIGNMTSGDEDSAKGNTAIPAQDRDRYATFGTDMKNLVGLNRASICDRLGRRLPLNTNVKVLPHLRIRQFRR